MGVYQRGGKYGIRYVDPYGKMVRETIGHNKRQAQRELVRRQAAIDEGRYQMSGRHSIRFDVFSEEYLKYAKAHKKSWLRDTVSLKNINPFFGDRWLDEISPHMVDQYKLKRLKVRTTASVNLELKLIRYMYNLAIKWGYARSNPVQEVKLLPLGPSKRRALNGEEIQKLLEACTEYSRPIVLLALRTGMRHAEITDLRWSDVNLFNRRLVVTKGKGGRSREIYFDEELRDVLAALYEKKTREYVFVSDKTKREIDSFKTAFLRAVKKSGIGHCRIHDLRHTYCSRMLQAGVDANTVKENMGHASITTTQLYLHTSPEVKKRASDLLKQYEEAEKCHKSDTKVIWLNTPVSVSPCNINDAPVAQLDRATDYESVG